MLRPGSAALVTLAATISLASPAEADSTELGAWFGPRVFSKDSLLGYIEEAPYHPMLENAFTFGVRVGRPFLPWLVPELELAMSPTKTTVTGAPSVSVFWLDPRLQLRFEILPGQRLQPFMIVGGGSPIALSSARQTFDSGIVGDGFLGGGLRFDSYKGFQIRGDARVSFLPGADALIAVEVEVGFGLEVQFGERRRRPTAEEERVTKGGPPPDKDSDKIPDAQDRCPDRAEDIDKFDDTDGCPDIDNDLDRILDIADKCGNEPEKYNGFEDDDGCPDNVPSEVDSLRGTVEGLIYAEGETVVRESALPSIRKIAKLMTGQPTIRVVLIGHTDDREAKQFATVEKGQPAPDLGALSADLSRARAEAVKQVLVNEGIVATRIDVDGHGSEEPVVDNDKARGRLANRRVEIKLYVPPSSK